MNVNANALIRANPDAPQDAAAAMRLARKLFVPHDHRLERGFMLELSTGPQLFEADDVPRSEYCGEYSRGLVDLALASSILDQSDKEEIQAMISDAMPSLEKQKQTDCSDLHWRFARLP